MLIKEIINKIIIEYLNNQNNIIYHSPTLKFTSINTMIKEEIQRLNPSLIKKLQKELWNTEYWFQDNNYSTPKWQGKFSELDKLRDKQEKKAQTLRGELFKLTGDHYGVTKKEKEQKKIKPNGLNDEYNNPSEVPKNVYRWIQNNTDLLTSDATDAVRWYRIINTKNEKRYPRGGLTIYRAVENRNHNEIREGDWVTTDINYAKIHNKRYFDGGGTILSKEVDGKDVLVSPTGNVEEAIYAPLEYSIDIKL